MAKQKSNGQQTQVTDPLEAAKIRTQPPPVPVVPSPEPPQPQLFEPTGEVEVPGPPAKRYQVVRTTTISLRGQLVRLNAGDVLSESSHGPGDMKLIQDSGAPLLELRD